jgi:signal transduction histidine kinase
VALSRKAPGSRSRFDRTGRTGVIVQHPAAEGHPSARTDSVDALLDASSQTVIGVIESRLLDEARLEGVRLAAREIAHLLNNDLAVAVGLVDLLQDRLELPPHLMELLHGAALSLDSAARHVEDLQGVVRVVIKETPAGESLDLERSRR